MAGKFPERRKIYFIKKKFQINFILKFCLLVIIGAVLSGGVIYFMSRSTVTTTFENCRLTIKSTADFILPAVLLSGTVVIVFIGLAMVAVTLFTSHRIAGPLYRMEKDVEEVAAGDLTKRFNLRRTDEIKALAQDLENMTQSLRTSIGEAKRLAQELETGLKERGELPIEFQQSLQKLIATLDKFRT